MKLQTKSELINVDLLIKKGLENIPKLYLDSPRIVLSEKYKKYEEVHLNNELIGSKKFLDVDNQVDIMVFYKQDLILQYLDIGIPFDLLDKHTLGQETIIEQVHNLTLETSEMFTLDKSKAAIYHKDQDMVSILYQSYSSYFETIVIMIGADFSVLTQKDVIVGWCLNNCCDYVCDYLGNYQKTTSANKTNILYAFFQIHSESTFVKMERKDLAFKEELESLKIKAELNGFSVVAEVIEEWIEDHYY